jgi:Tfp pilus assembly protein FimT
MKSADTYFRRRRQLASSSGFSLVELVVALAVAMVLAAIAIPNIVTTYSQYRLGVQATLIANELDQLRMTAVRRNSTVTLSSATPSSLSGRTVLYIDANKSGSYDATDPQVVLPSDMQISNSGTPPTGMPGVTALPSTYSAAVKLPTSGITFNANGTINSGAGPYFIVIGYTSTSKYGYRAITVTPMGQIKVWSASSGASAWSSTS